MSIDMVARIPALFGMRLRVVAWELLLRIM